MSETPRPEPATLLDGVAFDASGLVPVVAQEAATGQVRMVELADGSGRKEKLNIDIDGSRFMVVDAGGGTVDITYKDQGYEERHRGSLPPASLGTKSLRRSSALAIVRLSC